MDFVNLQEYCTAAYQVTCDGKVVSSGQIDMESVAPRTEARLSIPVTGPEAGRCFLKVTYALKEAEEIRPAGFILGFDEIALKNRDSRNQTNVQLWSAGNTAEPVSVVEESDRFLVVQSEAFTYVYNKLTGVFESMKFHGSDLITRPMNVNIWRAPTDNDKKIKLEWMDAQYDRCMTRTYETSCEIVNGEVRIHSVMAVLAPSVQRLMDMDTIWTISGDGAVALCMDVARDMRFPELPRFGIRMFLPKEMEEVCYCGIGPMESYCDKRIAGSYGVYTHKAADMHEDYIRPQENGSHCDCDYVQISSDTMMLSAVGAKAIAFNASVYTQEELTEKKHNYELIPCGSTVLCLDYAQAGIGSQSCGPKLMEKYQLDEETFTFAVKLIPAVK